MFVKMFLEKLFFKKRLVFCAPRKLKAQNLPGRYYLHIIDNRNAEAISQYANMPRKTVTAKRLQKQNWIFFLLVDRSTKEIAAYSWVILGNGKYYWHDNYVVYPDAALLCNDFVKKKYRNLGIHKYLIYRRLTYLLDKNIHKVFAIVENSNTASLKAYSSAGFSVYCTNYLFKLFSINIISLFTASTNIKMVLFGSRLCKLILYREIAF